MFNWLARGQFVEHLVRQRKGAGVLQLSKDAGAAPAVEPGRDGVGAFGRDQCPIEVEQLGVGCGRPRRRTVLAAAAARRSGHTAVFANDVRADHTPGTCARIRARFACTRRSAGPRGCRHGWVVLLRRRRIGPIVSGRRHTTGDRSRPKWCTVRCGGKCALGDGPRSATCAARAVLGADVNRSPTVAFDADFLIDRVDNQARRTQRPTVFVADGDLANRSAACAWLCPGRCSCGTTTFHRSADAGESPVRSPGRPGG